jgi:hypothetical protein
MPARRIELGSNLYLIASERPIATHCIVMASYAGSKTCRGFQVPSGASLSFYGFDAPKVTKQQWKQSAATPYGYGSRVGLLAARMALQVVGADASLAAANIARHESGKIAANPMLRKFDFAHEAAYQLKVDDDGEDHAESIDYYQALEQAVDSIDSDLDGLDKLKQKYGIGGCDIASVRNRRFHPGVTLQDVISEVREYRRSMADFMVPFPEPVVGSVSSA